jgi:hypothetical protein
MMLNLLDVHIVILVRPPLGVPTVYGPFTSKDEAYKWAANNMPSSCNAYIGKVYLPDELAKHTLVIPNGNNSG